VLGSEIKNKVITVVGAARSGLAVAILCHEQGGKVLISDSSFPGNADQVVSDLQSRGIKFEFGGHTKAALDCDWLIVSPGVPIDSPLVKEAGKAGKAVFGELEVASWFSKAKIAAITGSNGKSTTSALLADMVRGAGKPCVLAGNIGESFAGLVEKTSTDGIAVLEVSSFQLETIATFHPAVAILLNLTPDHLDRHGSMTEYGRLKARIFENQKAGDVVVYNGLDEKICRLTEEAAADSWVFGKKTAGNSAFVEHGNLILKIDGKEMLLISTADMLLKGEHNQQNVMAAALAAIALGINMAAIRQSLKTFTGLHHRMEYITTINEVDWVNDSKATNVDAVWYALGGYTKPVILIAGGRDKNSDFTLLAKRVGQRVRKVVLIGEAAKIMGEAFKSEVPVVFAESLEDAVQEAAKAAEPGDTVLLSPACASFDMFDNFEDRGDKFKELVRELSHAV